MKQINRIVLQTSLHEMLRCVNDYATDVYIRENPVDGVTAQEILHYYASMSSPKALKKALKDGIVCCAIYFDLAEIEKLHSARVEFTVQILDDEGNEWAELTEDELGEW